MYQPIDTYISNTLAQYWNTFLSCSTLKMVYAGHLNDTDNKTSGSPSATVSSNTTPIFSVSIDVAAQVGRNARLRALTRVASGNPAPATIAGLQSAGANTWAGTPR
jgi:hypothetical protein